MTHALPDKPAPWWARLVAAIRYVANLEPVAVAAVWRAVVAVLAASGLVVSHQVDGRVTATIVAAYGLIELLTTIRARAKVAPLAKVVESVQTIGGAQQVVAGPANAIPTGVVIRPADDQPLYPGA